MLQDTVPADHDHACTAILFYRIELVKQTGETFDSGILVFCTQSSAGCSEIPVLIVSVCSTLVNSVIIALIIFISY
jgi:hypothetical protein